MRGVANHMKSKVNTEHSKGDQQSEHDTDIGNEIMVTITKIEL